MVRAAAQRGIRLSPAKDGFDEAFEPSGAVRPHYRPLVSTLRGSTPADLERRERLQKLSLMSLGITFTVYGAEFHSPTHGWVPFDPTHDREVDDRYVVVAHGRHYDDVPPNKGIYRGSARETLHAEVRTEIPSRKPVSTLHEEIRQIDLPVYQEMPERRVERAITPLEEAAAQQQ